MLPEYRPVKALNDFVDYVWSFYGEHDDTSRSWTYDTKMTFLLNLSEEPYEGGDFIIDVMTQKYERFFSKRILTSLRPEFTISPLKDKRDHAYRFYLNGVVKVTGSQDSIELIPYSHLPENAFVWADQIIDRVYDPSFLKSPSKDEFEAELTLSLIHI